MTNDRPARALRFGADNSAAARQVISVGSWKIPVSAVAWGLSAVIHAGLLAASYFVTWSPAAVSSPKISFARGDQAARLQVLLAPWPDPAEKEETREEAGEDIPAAESSAVTVSAEKVDVAPLSEDVAPDNRLDPPVTASEDRDLFAEKEPEATDAADGRALEDVRDVPSADDTLEVVVEVLDYLFDRLARFITAPETKEQQDAKSLSQKPGFQAPRRPKPAAQRVIGTGSKQPLVAEASEKAVVLPVEKPSESNAPLSQEAGIETGVEMLDLPTPKYPLLSRKRGEEGLVLLKVEVLPDGSVGDITVLRDAGFVRLTEAAIAAARKARFKPATRNGQPVRAVVRIPFRFVLR